MKPLRIKLTVTQGSLAGTEYVFEDRAQCIVGRATDCDIQLPLDYAHSNVSRHHCVFAIDPPAVRVRDLGSVNGTYVNGHKIGQRPQHLPPEEADLSTCLPCELHSGDEVQVGQIVLRVDIDRPGEQS